MLVCGYGKVSCCLFYYKYCTLVLTGRLPPPENINAFNIIKWNPPYSSLNNESTVIHVDPHITQYTVHIIDNRTGIVIHEVNVRETHYTVSSDASDDGSCPMYCITAWNAGGEGRMSAPVYPPLGKHYHSFISTFSVDTGIVTADCTSVQIFADSVTVLKVSRQELPVGVASQKRHGPEHAGVRKLRALCVSVILAEHSFRKNLRNTQIFERKCNPLYILILILIFCIIVPRSVAAEDVTITAESGGLLIRLHVCKFPVFSSLHQGCM